MVAAGKERSMAYGICRIQKLKAGSVGGSAQHTNRQRYTPNADPEKQHIRIIGQPDGPNTPDLETIVRQRIGEQFSDAGFVFTRVGTRKRGEVACA